MRSKHILSSLLVPLVTTLATAAEPQRTLSVVGQGSATAPPDMATFETAVVTQAATAAEALAANNEASRAVLEILKQAQIADKDVQTSRFDISPVYRTNREGQDPKISGYQVTNQVTVVVRSLASLGQVLDAVVKSGSNQVQGIRFDIDNKTGVLNQARNRAVQDARARADLLAQAAGVHVGKVLTIQETGAAGPPPMPMMRMAMAESAVPVATGEQELSASVSIMYELVD
jgi:uncharacterized protein YggE